MPEHPGGEEVDDRARAEFSEPLGCPTPVKNRRLPARGRRILRLHRRRRFPLPGRHSGGPRRDRSSLRPAVSSRARTRSNRPRRSCGPPARRPSPCRRRAGPRRASVPPSHRSVARLENADGGGFIRRCALRLTGPPRAGSPTRPTPGLTFVTPGVLSTARLARRGRPVADCRGCSVECRCCAPPAGRTGSESHSTRRPICRKAALGRTYGNLPGSAARWFSQAPGGFLPPASRFLGRSPSQGNPYGYFRQ